MTGFRVAHQKKSAKGQNRSNSVPSKKDEYPILYAIFLLLSAIGHPFYLMLTGVLVFLFSIVWHIGNLVLTASQSTLYKTSQVKHSVLSFKLPKLKIPKFYSFSKKKKPKKKTKKKTRQFATLPTFTLPQLSLPTFNLSFILPSFSMPNIPRIRLKKRYKLTFLVLLFISVSWLSFWLFLLRGLPKPGTLTTRPQTVSTKIYDRNGVLLYKVYKNENRTLLHLSDIPTNVRNATIAIEDEDFYSHPGFSVRGITRAFFKNLTHGELTGGSTITQQLVKTTLLSPEKTLLRKVKEIILAIEVEMAYSKDQILEMYLNEVSYGGSSYGIEEASQTYFAKHASELNLAEAALLAGLTQRPTAYSPFGTNPELANARQKEVLQKMFEQGYITYDDQQKAKSESLAFAKPRNDIKAPHFVMYVKQLLAEKYGEDMVEEGGLEVTTSLDLSTQDMAQSHVHNEVEKIKRLNINNGAALVTNPQNGEVLAMVGSSDYFDKAHDGNVNVTISQRQPGSSIKPVNYSYAIENGIYSAASVISDTPITYSIPGSPSYTPRNYDGRYHGNVTIRSALAQSLNIPAVKILASYGVPKMVEHAKKLGITTWDNSSRFGLSLTLGAGEVKMTDMAVVYGTFANYGRRVDLKPILRVVDYRGEVLQDNTCAPINTVEKPKQESLVTKVVQIFKPKFAYAEEAPTPPCGRQVISSQSAFIITNILSDNAARTPTFGPRSQLVIDRHPEIAVKTGTTQSLRDNWTIGYNQQYMVLTWVGNNNNQAMSYVASGVTGASPIWHKIMTSLVENKPSLAWQEPGGVVRANVCLGSAMRKDYFILGHEPKTQCVIKKPEGENPEDPSHPQPTPQGQVL
jgi:1A family penicillin-binding protein